MRQRLFFSGAIWLASIPGAGQIFAQTAEGEDNQKAPVDQVEVVAPRPGQNNQAVSSSGAVTVIETGDLAARYTSIDELLEKAAGVRVQRYGGQGAYSAISIRGSTPNQVQVYVDGIPLNNAVSGEVNLADLNLQGIERIEIYRSGDFPGSPIGGAVNLVTRRDRPPGDGRRLGLYGGSFQTIGTNAELWGGEALRYDLALRAEKSDQDFRFRNDNGTPVLNTYDDFDDRRRNAQYENVFHTAKLSWRWWETDFTFLNDGTYRLHGVPGPGSAQTEQSRRKLLRNTSGLSTDSRGLFADWFRLQTQLFYTGYWLQFYDPQQELSFQSPDQRSRLQHFGLQIQPSFYLLDYHQIVRLHFAAAQEIYHSDRRDRTHRLIERLPTRFRNHYTARISDEIFFWDERIKLTPAVEYQRFVARFNDDENDRLNAGDDADRALTEFVNYRFAALVVPWKAETAQFYLKGGVSTGKRTPLFIELFGEAGAVIGNSDLRPEESETVEAGPGFSWAGGWLRGEVEAIAFQRLMRDMILFVPNSQFTLRPENVDRARITGVEFSSRLEILEQWQFYLNYTYQRAINESDVSFLRGRYLALRPLHEMHAGLAWRNGWLELGSEAVFVGAVYRDRSNEAQNYQAARWLYNLYARWTILGDARSAEQLLLGVDLKNVLDDRVSDIVNYPLPGRSVYVSLSYRF